MLFWSSCALLCPAGEFGLRHSGMCCCRWGAEDQVWSQGMSWPTAHGGLQKENSARSIPVLFSTEILTGGLGFTGNSQALSKSLLLKNLVFFRFLVMELKQLRQPFSRLNLFRLRSYRRQHSLLFPMSLVHTSTRDLSPSRGVTLLFPVFSTPVLYWLAALFSKCKRFDEREYTGTFLVTSIFCLTYTRIWMLNGICLSAACLCSLLCYLWTSWIDRVGIFFF